MNAATACRACGHDVYWHRETGRRLPCAMWACDCGDFQAEDEVWEPGTGEPSEARAA